MLRLAYKVDLRNYKVVEKKFNPRYVEIHLIPTDFENQKLMNRKLKDISKIFNLEQLSIHFPWQFNLNHNSWSTFISTLRMISENFHSVNKVFLNFHIIPDYPKEFLKTFSMKELARLKKFCLIHSAATIQLAQKLLNEFSTNIVLTLENNDHTSDANRPIIIFNAAEDFGYVKMTKRLKICVDVCHVAMNQLYFVSGRGEVISLEVDRHFYKGIPKSLKPKFRDGKLDVTNYFSSMRKDIAFFHVSGCKSYVKKEGNFGIEIGSKGDVINWERFIENVKRFGKRELMLVIETKKAHVNFDEVEKSYETLSEVIY